MKKTRIITTDDILLTLCQAVNGVLSAAGNPAISHSPMVQKIQKTCLRPDLGCFVLFDGGFSGLVIINFTAPAALEIYRKYMMSMGMPENELAQFHTSDEVGNVMGELMNQIVGDFTNKVRLDLHTSINQSQPKMMAINKQVQILINTQLDQPQARRVTFSTPEHNIFYMELAMDKTEFIQLQEFEKSEQEPPDDILANAQQYRQENTVDVEPAVDDDFLKNLGF
ncbi:MAG: chemotaxis protein CheX [Rheinheimera sp.]|nr:chemotaxis protein CheX [Rheinheimera sp.]